MYPIDSKDKWIALGLLGFVVLAIIIAFVILYFRRHPFAPVSQVKPVVVITPTPLPTVQNILVGKFAEPSSLTVRLGDTVSIMNFSDKSIEIVSDNANNPEMNLGVIENNQSKEVLMTKKGTYSYHNSLNPEQKGVVIVQ